VIAQSNSYIPNRKRV